MRFHHAAPGYGYFAEPEFAGYAEPDYGYAESDYGYYAEDPYGEDPFGWYAEPEFAGYAEDPYGYAESDYGWYGEPELAGCGYYGAPGYGDYAEEPIGYYAYAEDPYGEADYAEADYGGYGEDPYGEDPYGEDPYGEAEYAEADYGEAEYGEPEMVGYAEYEPMSGYQHDRPSKFNPRVSVATNVHGYEEAPGFEGYRKPRRVSPRVERFEPGDTDEAPTPETFKPHW